MVKPVVKDTALMEGEAPKPKKKKKKSMVSFI